MSHVRPKENMAMQSTRQTMDLSEKRETLLHTLKLAYKKINSLNAATRKINAVMAILFMRRDKTKSDMDSMTRRLSAKIAMLQRTFEKDLSTIVDRKIKAMEDQVQVLFDEICTLGEVCVEAEKVLKIQNEHKLASDGTHLTETFESLLDSKHDGEDQGDLENLMFLQFVQGDLETKFDQGVFGHIFTSNKDSGISLACSNMSLDSNPEVSPIPELGSLLNSAHGSESQPGLKASEKGRTNQTLLHTIHNVPCPPGFEAGLAKKKSEMFPCVSTPANVVHTPSSQAKEPVAARKNESNQLTAKLLEEAMEVGANEETVMQMGAINPCNEESCNRSSDNSKLSPIIEKWDEDMYEITEMSSAMSIRLQKNIYDRKVSERNTKSSSKGSGDMCHSAPRSANKRSNSTESWDMALPDENSFHQQTRAVSSENPSHVRRLFDKELGSSKLNEKQNNGESWKDSTKGRIVNLKGNSTKGSEKESTDIENRPPKPFDVEAALRRFPCVTANGMDDWWDARGGDHSQYSFPVKKEKIDMQPVSSERRLENGQMTTGLGGAPGKSFRSSPLGKMPQQPGSTSLKLSPLAEEQGNDTVTEPERNCEIVSHESKGELDLNVKTSAISKEEDCQKGKKEYSSKKTYPIISGRMKNLLKTYIESNKESPMGGTIGGEDDSAGDSPSCPKSDTSRIVESSKSSKVDVLDKPKDGNHGDMDKVLSPLGHTLSKSRPLDMSLFSKPKLQEHMLSIKEEPQEEIQMETDVDYPGSTRAKVEGTSVALTTTKSEDKVMATRAQSPLQRKDDVAVKKDVDLEVAVKKEVHSPGSGTVSKKVAEIYTDLSRLVFSGNCWTEVNATLVSKIGHLKKGHGEGFFFPIGVGSNSHGDLIVADNGNDLVKVMKKDVLDFTIGMQADKFFSQSGVALSRPSAVVVNEKDELFVKDATGIFKFDVKGVLLEQIGQKILKRPYGLALTYTGHLVTLDVTRSDHLLYLFKQNGGVFRCSVFGPLSNNMAGSKCRFLEVFRDRVLVSDLGLSVMYLGNLCGQVFHCFGHYGTNPGFFREPSGVTVDSAGNWIIADSKNDRIQVFSPDGQYLFPIKLSDPIYRPSDIMLTRDRHLLVVNYLTHSVKVYRIG
ncbi:uncharacterized protein LOC124141263 isoform X1 [Haliotis rufescens]|uniref:uncharacterized protein LOC124141263 isoform X1 n=1 Tax=Haliotis rufescens TaxID=6454 RepID=UPI00201F6280|nr:uncharacterized protein LOC124141263 isoform X1 [Haliotis rufescens]